MAGMDADTAAYELVQFSLWCYYQKRDRTPEREEEEPPPPDRTPRLSLTQSIDDLFDAMTQLVEARPVEPVVIDEDAPNMEMPAEPEWMEIEDIDPELLHDSLNLTTKLRHFEFLLNELNYEERLQLCHSEVDIFNLSYRSSMIYAFTQLVLGKLSVEHVCILARDLSLETFAEIIPLVCMWNNEVTQTINVLTGGSTWKRSDL